MRADFYSAIRFPATSSLPPSNHMVMHAEAVSIIYPNHYTTFHYRNLKTSNALLKNQAHQAISLFTSAATNQRFFKEDGQEKLRSDF